MIKVVPVTMLLAGAILLAPLSPSLAISSEAAPMASDGSSLAVDPDNALDEMANPDSGANGSATIEVPPIDIPQSDSDDYSPPDSEDDPAQDLPSPQGDSTN